MLNLSICRDMIEVRKWRIFVFVCMISQEASFHVSVAWCLGELPPLSEDEQDLLEVSLRFGLGLSGKEGLSNHLPFAKHLQFVEFELD